MYVILKLNIDYKISNPIKCYANSIVPEFFYKTLSKSKLHGIVGILKQFYVIENIF